MSENGAGIVESLHKKFIFADLAEKQLGTAKLSVLNSLVNGLALLSPVISFNPSALFS